MNQVFAVSVLGYLPLAMGSLDSSNWSTVGVDPFLERLHLLRGEVVTRQAPISPARPFRGVR